MRREEDRRALAPSRLISSIRTPPGTCFVLSASEAFRDIGTGGSQRSGLKS
jgi:hypothetical protein